MVNSDQLDNKATRAVLAVLAGARSFGDIAQRTGMSRNVAYQAACRAKQFGAVTWEPGKGGTLRPKVAVINMKGTDDRR